jgi:hypothetical protein
VNDPLPSRKKVWPHDALVLPLGWRRPGLRCGLMGTRQRPSKSHCHHSQEPLSPLRSLTRLLRTFSSRPKRGDFLRVAHRFRDSQPETCDHCGGAPLLRALTGELCGNWLYDRLKKLS